MAKKKKTEPIPDEHPIVDKEGSSSIASALVRIVLMSRVTRRLLAEHSLRFFAYYYFGIHLSRAQEKWAYKLIKSKKGGVLAPCSHGKTELTSKIIPLWLIVRNRNIRVLLVSKSDGLALKNLGVIKHELEHNQRLINDYGRFYSPDNVWTGHQLYVIRTKAHKDPTIEAIGLNGAITGGRFDVIILDDILDVLNTREEGQRDKTKDYVEGTLITRLEPWGVIWFVGTRKHYDDLYAHLLRNKSWTIMHDKAILREPEGWRIVDSDTPIELVDSDGNKYEVYQRIEFDTADRGEVLWPEKWPIENLLLLRYSIGTVVFNREYQNVILSDENALFKLAWMMACRDETLSYIDGAVEEYHRQRYSLFFQGSDLALVDTKKKAEKRKSDYTVVVTIGINRVSGLEELVGLERQRGLSPKSVQELVVKEYLRFQPTFHFLEANNFGLLHAESLIERWHLTRLVKHVTHATNKSDLYSGVPALSVKFENQRIRLPYRTAKDQERTDKLISEFVGLGVEDHDDLVMGMWFCDCGIMRYKVGNTGKRKDIKRPTVKRK